MKQDDSLFILIKSLGRNEKGYFKKFVSKHTSDSEKNVSVKLFDIISNLASYDETAIRREMTKDRVREDLSVYKNYLYKIILKSLRSYYAESSVDSRLQDMLKDAEILYKKSLYTDCEGILLRSLKLAKKYEKHAFLLEIYANLYKLMVVLENDSTKFEKFLTQHYDEQLEILHNYKEIIDLRMIIAEVNYLRREKSDKVNTAKKLDKILKSPLLGAKMKFSSYRAGLNYFNVLGHIHGAELHDPTRGYYYNKKYLEFMEGNKDNLSEEVGHYTSCLNNLMINLIDLKKYDEFNVALQKLKNISVKFPDWKLRVLEKEWNLMLSYYLKTGKIKEGLKYIENNKENLLSNTFLIAEGMKVAIYDSISILYFIAGDTSESLWWVNQIIQSKWDARKDIQCFTHFLFLLIHFEKNNQELIQSSYNRISRFIENYSDEHETVGLMLSFIKTTSILDNKKELNEALLKLKQKLIVNKKKFESPPIFEYFDPLMWVESKLQKADMIDLV